MATLIPTPFTINSPKVKFTGKVMPDFMKVTLALKPTIRWDNQEFNYQCMYVVSIEESQITVECFLDRYEERFQMLLYARSIDLARAALDVACFSQGFIVTAIIDTCENPDGTVSRLFIQDSDLSPLCTAYGVDRRSLLSALEMILPNPALHLALNDLIAGHANLHNAAINSARCIEGLRALMAPAGTSRSDAWALMRANLRLEKSYPEFVTTLSQAPRHGDRSAIPWYDSREALRRGWTIMNRYLEFRKRGEHPLPADEFPLLS
jgi:hypothetical protein